MTHSELWKAIRDQATLWAETPVFKRFTAALPRNASQRSTGLPGALQNYDAAGARIGARPLRSSSEVLLFRDQMPGFMMDSDVPIQGWLADAGRVEAAHRESIAWIRSRLPRYPGLLAPQLARDSPLTTPEFTWRLAWSRADLSSGLQFRTNPGRTEALLDATPEQSQRLNQSIRIVCSAFEATDEWKRFARISEELEPNAVEQLSSARLALRQKLKAEAVDTFEPNLAMPRNAYRENSMGEVLESLSGTAREYAEAFASVDLLIETAASDVFGQLAAYGNPKRFEQVRDIDFEPGELRQVHFTLGDDVFPEMGLLVWAEDPLLKDVLLVQGINISFEKSTGTQSRMTGLILKGSGMAWRAVS